MCQAAFQNEHAEVNILRSNLGEAEIRTQVRLSLLARSLQLRGTKIIQSRYDDPGP